MPANFLHGIETIEVTTGARPVQTVRSSIVGLVGTAEDADAAAFPLDTPVLITGPTQAAALGAGGTLRDAYDAVWRQGAAVAVVVRVAEGLDEAATLANVAGSVSAQTGAFALELAGSVVQQTPRILAAPGWTGQRPSAAANPVVASMLSIAGRMRAVIVADGPGTNEADALTYAGDYGSDRVYIVDPGVLVFDPVTSAPAERPASGYAAGAIAARDLSRGFWWSPSNTPLNGVIGAARPITFRINETETEANRLNEAKVATIVHQNGYRLWGNRTTATDPLWAFLPVRRTADMIYESVEQALLWAMDRPITGQTIADVRDTVQGYLNTLIARGALIGGQVWIDPEKNTAVTLQAGQLSLDFDIEPPAPLERLTFTASRNGDYYEELVATLSEA